MQPFDRVSVPVGTCLPYNLSGVRNTIPHTGEKGLGTNDPATGPADSMFDGT